MQGVCGTHKGCLKVVLCDFGYHVGTSVKCYNRKVENPGQGDTPPPSSTTPPPPPSTRPWNAMAALNAVGGQLGHHRRRRCAAPPPGRHRRQRWSPTTPTRPTPTPRSPQLTTPPSLQPTRTPPRTEDITVDANAARCTSQNVNCSHPLRTISNLKWPHTCSKKKEKCRIQKLSNFGCVGVP